MITGQQKGDERRNAIPSSLTARRLLGRLAGVLALGAVGDVLLEAVGLQAGAAAFLFGHLLAIWLYLRHRVRDWSWPLGLMIPVVVGVSVWLPGDRAAVGLLVSVLTMS